MNLTTISNYEDVTGFHHIKTKEGTIFLNSLIKNHPLSVVDILVEEGYDGLIKLVLERERDYLKVKEEHPNDLDMARDALYGEYKYDSDLDMEIDNLKERIWRMEERKGNKFEYSDYLTEQEMATLSEDKKAELYDARYAEKLRREEAEIVKLQGQLDDKISFKESLSPIELHFLPKASEMLEGIPTDDVIFF